MQLTGTPFLILTVILVPVSITVALLFWGKVRGSNPVRILSRLVMIMFCQVTAVLMVFVMVNNANLIYGNWDDLLGTGDHVRAVPSLPPAEPGAPAGNQGGDAAKQPPKITQKFAGVNDPAVPNDVQKTELKGQVSGVDGEVLVWLPPQYNDPAFKDKKFPVVELIPGYPGSSSTWYGTLKVSEQLKPLMQQGKVAPFILVSPRTLLLGNHQDAGCTDIPGKINADAWITRDVPQMVLDNFRADPSSDRWAIAGYSAGAHCAAKLSLAHPNRYRAGISMSGYNDPAAESDSLVGKDPKLREANNPITILKTAQTPPKVNLFISGKKGDGLEDAQAIAAAAKEPTKVQVQESNGPHTTELWKTMVPSVFEWLTGVIPAQ
ncbi:enterochelin esterase-like enzyme [Kitasatospora sp. MAA19]|uniref:alpha/beta hydrolase n=1 Tax=unclassified Kitasatospora TaxID=2633591 RepID=UPI002473A57F|nr:alpha/beta hydrolase-fold protein [Kitasatospora sp. MAA19]MDH6706811.1 enterochelin esterase-like enzyme [Kitasatospora sp. MAA19]